MDRLEGKIEARAISFSGGRSSSVCEGRGITSRSTMCKAVLAVVCCFYGFTARGYVGVDSLVRKSKELTRCSGYVTATTKKADCAMTLSNCIQDQLQFVDWRLAQQSFISSGEYLNKADFDALIRLFNMIKRLGLGMKESTVFVGGTNDGQSSLQMLDICPELSFVGFEIQKLHFETASGAVGKYPNARVVNLGWSERAEDDVAIGAAGELGGLFDPKGQRGWELQNETASTTSMAAWARENSINQVLYVVIDTEGHEPKVIRGMKLSEVENQKRFALFQYELGGTWAANDERHGHDQWTQFDTARHLESFGYMLFICGSNDWFVVNADFFNETDNPAIQDEGFGPFIQGNVLAAHPRFINPDLLMGILVMSKVEGLQSNKENCTSECEDNQFDVDVF